MNIIFKFASITYLIILSLVLLIPLDSTVVNQIIEKEKHPSNNFSFIIHFLLFFSLYFLFNLSFINKRKILIFVILYSIIIEFLQIFTSRGFQFFDIVSNLAGCLVGFLLFSIMLKSNYLNWKFATPLFTNLILKCKKRSIKIISLLV